MKDYHDDFFASLQNETLNKINELVKKRSEIQLKSKHLITI
ncbi:MAG: hypothetical protein SPL00_04910 [Bacilli bacterium]|nr:hypothetical protein [Bacilli bacterium]